MAVVDDGSDPSHEPECTDHESALMPSGGHESATIELEGFTNSLGMQFVMIPPGEFMLGSSPDERWRHDNEFKHRVRISRSFLLGTTEVTQKEWLSVISANPSYFKGDDLPVDSISWKEAVEYCHRLSDKEGRRYRLPTEAEWEYACRAGTSRAFYTGDSIGANQANLTTMGGSYTGQTLPVGSFPANPWGLYDMHGNVREWCADWFGDYPNELVIDPSGPLSGRLRVVRGGCWGSYESTARSACRNYAGEPLGRSWLRGFRVALDP